MLIIKDAQIDDIAEITILMNELGYPTSIIEMTGRFKMIAEHIDYKTIIAVLNGEIVGMAGLAKGIFYEKNGLYVRILAFVVKEDSRGKGIGKDLIKACEDWAAKQGINTMLVNSGNRANRMAAHLFYGKMGYQIKSSGFVKEL